MRAVARREDLLWAKDFPAITEEGWIERDIPWCTNEHFYCLIDLCGIDNIRIASLSMYGGRIRGHVHINQTAVDNFAKFLENETAVDKKSHRVLLRVDAVSDINIDIVIPSWDPDITLVLPKDILEKNIRDTVKAANYLLGDVNIGTRHAKDLCFTHVNEIVDKPPKDLL